MERKAKRETAETNNEQMSLLSKPKVGQVHMRQPTANPCNSCIKIRTTNHGEALVLSRAGTEPRWQKEQSDECTVRKYKAAY